MKIFNIEPIAKPRMTRSDKWRERGVVMRYWSYKSDMLKEALESGFKIGKEIELIFLIPMPSSWNNKKKTKMLGKSHEQKPDTDNLLKAFCDALTEDDSKIWSKKAKKYWWSEGRTIVVVNKEESGKFDKDYNNTRNI